MPGKGLSCGLFLITGTSAAGISRLQKRRAASMLYSDYRLRLCRGKPCGTKCLSTSFAPSLSLQKDRQHGVAAVGR